MLAYIPRIVIGLIFLTTGILCGSNIHHPLPIILHWIVPVVIGFSVAAIYSGIMSQKLQTSDPVKSDIYIHYASECCWNIIKLVLFASISLMIASIFDN